MKRFVVEVDRHGRVTRFGSREVRRRSLWCGPAQMLVVFMAFVAVLLGEGWLVLEIPLLVLLIALALRENARERGQ